MSKIALPKETQDALSKAVSRFLKDEFDLEVTGFDAVFLADFVTDTFGPHFYNQGLADAQALLSTRLDELGEAIFQLEKPVKPAR
jgi:uncharacterized protein (DUF2164 family)